MFELEAPVEESRARAAIRSALRFVPRLGVAAFFVVIGYTKFDDDPRGEWVEIFERIGLGQWFRYFTGALQMTGGLLMLSRRTLTIGAAMLACTMLGAAIVDAVFFGPLLIIPLMLLFLIATVWVTSQ